MRQKAKGLIATDETIELTVLPAKYPQGGERQLIQAVLKREVPMGQLPADAGVIVSNVELPKPLQIRFSEISRLRNGSLP